MSNSSSASRPFDEQLWPIHVALAAWACVLAGVVVALGGFDDPRLWHNGWARLATIAATLALLAWAASTVDAGHARRLKLAVVLSLMFHTVLVVGLCRQRLKLDTSSTVAEQVAARDQPIDASAREQFTLHDQGDPSRREAFDRPVSTSAPTEAGSRLAAAHHASTDTDSIQQPITEPRAKPQPAPRLLPLRRPRQALAQQAPAPGERSRRPRQDAVPASAVADARPELPKVSLPPARRAPSASLPVGPTDTPPAAELARHHRSAAPQTAIEVVSSVPELPAQVPTQDLPRQAPADPLPTIAQDWTSARSRRRVEAAPLPEMSSEARRLAEQAMTRATRIGDAQPSDLVRTPPTPHLDAVARQGAADAPATHSGTDAAAGLASAATSVITGPPLTVGAADSRTAGRLSATSLPRRRTSEAEPGLRSGGGLDRPLRSRGPPPAAPVLAPLPLLATTTPSARTPADAVDMPSIASGARGRSAQSRPDRDAVARVPHDGLDDAVARVPVATDAPVGSGGLARAADDEPGLPDRLAARDADLIHSSPDRLPSREAGGAPAPDGTSRRPAAAFARRHARPQPPNGAEGRPSSKTEAAIELGLEFLARAQLDDGRWTFAHLGSEADATDSPPIIRADAAATGLALLSFLGAGYDHFDDRYQHVVERGLDFLVRSQTPSGEVFPEEGLAVGQVTRFYSHGIATLALCEAYGMTGDPRLRRPAQAALDYLAATQHADRGGWRYDAGVSADLSVTGWQLLALRSGELAGLHIRPQTYRGIHYLVERCRAQGDGRALFRYNPWASPNDSRTRHGLQPSTVMTSVGLLVELYLDGDRDDPRLRRGADHLLANLPQLGAANAGAVAPTGTLGNPLRDTYYWYYATQVMFHMGGEYWAKWNEALHPLLVDSQTPAGPLAGSWDPARPVPDKWSAYGGRIYVTTLDLLSLEVTYRHLPLYNTAVPQMADRP